MKSCLNSALLSLLLVPLISISLLECARSRDRQPSAPSRSSPAKSNTGGDSDLTDECPEPNGYFADGYQCDKYYECVEGVINEKLCPDGMVFNDYSILQEKCDLPFNIDCSSRPQLQEPKPSANCPRQNGYFAHENVTICDKFYYCVDGKYNMITCPSGLVYNEKTGICTWPDEAKKKHCSSEDELNGREKKRHKRVSVWRDENDRSDEGDDDEDSEIYVDYEERGERSSGERDYDDYDSSMEFNSRELMFPTDPEFENFELSDESTSPEDSKEELRKRRRNDDFVEKKLDDYIREYVKQANKGGGAKAAGFDLRYYEKIAEEAVDKENRKKEEKNKSKVNQNVLLAGKLIVRKRQHHAPANHNRVTFGRTVVRTRRPTVNAKMEARSGDVPRRRAVSNQNATSHINHLSAPRYSHPHYNCFGVFKFECPKVDMTFAQQHPRYADPEDCQFFYVCINGEIPRRNGCKRGQVFNEVTGACDWPRNVPECRDWYKGILTDEELEALENPKPRVRTDSAAAQKRKGQLRHADDKH